MDVRELFNHLKYDFYAGVPDSTLRPVCDYLMEKKGISAHHIIAANEGNCVGLAAGYYMATGKIPVVYLQNSGLGNIANPVISLLNGQVYGIPCLFLVGWRGEPGIPDEPQHIFQGQVTKILLDDMDVIPFYVSDLSTKDDVENMLSEVDELLKQKRQVALVFSKKALTSDSKKKYQNAYSLNRETTIKKILKWSGEDVVVASTGKISRELFEIREENKQGHQRDFLTVGSMGHSSSIALGIAMHKPDIRIWCLDGDGAVLMHMGAIALIGASNPNNLVHVVFNNAAHESVGGLPTVMHQVKLHDMARAAGYQRVYQVEHSSELEVILNRVREEKLLTFIEIKTAIGSRDDLGRPTVSPQDNLKDFMNYLSKPPCPDA